MKEAAIEQKIKSVEKIGEAGNPKAGFIPTNQDDEKSNELERL